MFIFTLLYVLILMYCIHNLWQICVSSYWIMIDAVELYSDKALKHCLPSGIPSWIWIDVDVTTNTLSNSLTLWLFLFVTCPIWPKGSATFPKWEWDVSCWYGIFSATRTSLASGNRLHTCEYYAHKPCETVCKNTKTRHWGSLRVHFHYYVAQTHQLNAIFH